MQRCIMPWSQPPPHLQTHTYAQTFELLPIYTQQQITVQCYIQTKHALCSQTKHSLCICLTLISVDLKWWCFFVLRHLPDLSPWAWGKPPATQWPPWQCLPAAAWLPGGCLVWFSLPHTSVTTPGGVSSKPAGQERKGGKDGEKAEGKESRIEIKTEEKEKWGHISQQTMPGYDGLLALASSEFKEYYIWLWKKGQRGSVEKLKSTVQHSGDC